MNAILLVCDIAPTKLGSYERFLIELARTCHLQGVRLALALPGEPIAVVAEAFRAAKLRWWTIPGWKDEADRERPWAFLRGFLRLSRLERWDMVGFHFCNELSVLAACGVARLLHGQRFARIWVQHSEIQPASSLKRLCSRIRLQGAYGDGLIVNTRRGLNEVLRRGCPLERVRYIPNAVPIPTSARRDWLRHELGLPDDAQLIASVGSLIARKGFDVLLDAVAPLFLGQPRRHLVIAGDGPQRGKLSKQSEQLGIAGQVHFLGLRSDVADVLADCNLFALATRSETLTLAVLEAMAAGLPVVISDVGGHRELVDDRGTGSIVPPNDVLRLRHAIAQFLEDPELARRAGRAGRALVEQSFDLRQQVAAHFHYYDEVVKAVQVTRLSPAATLVPAQYTHRHINSSIPYVSTPGFPAV